MATARISASVKSIPAAGQARTGRFVYGNAEPQVGEGLFHPQIFVRQNPRSTSSYSEAQGGIEAVTGLLPPRAPPLEDLFSALHRHTQNFEYDQVVKIADQVLVVASGDEDALWCKVVALIKSDAIEKALLAIAAADRLSIDLGF